MSQIQHSQGVYALDCFSPGARAAFSGREFTRKDYPDFIQKAGFRQEALVLVHQVHGADVICVKSGVIPEQTVEADGLLTNEPGLVIGVKTADCLPVFLEDPIRRVVGIVHAGWRGLLAGILEGTISKMTAVYGSRPGDLRAAIGPAIRGCCYEVGPEFRDYFPTFYTEGRRSKADVPGGMFDPVQAAISSLQSRGLALDRVTDSGLCTACRNDLFYSFRAENTEERLLSVIALCNG